MKTKKFSTGSRVLTASVLSLAVLAARDFISHEARAPKKGQNVSSTQIQDSRNYANTLSIAGLMSGISAYNQIRSHLTPNQAPQTLASRYPNFRFPEELETIVFHANRYGVDPAILLAIREAENGRDGLQFGIINTESYNADRGYTIGNEFHPYPNELHHQSAQAVVTVRNNQQRWEQLAPVQRQAYDNDFFNFLGSRYAPIGADNDPDDLNQNWSANVRAGFNIHRRN